MKQLSILFLVVAFFSSKAQQTKAISFSQGFNQANRIVQAGNTVRFNQIKGAPNDVRVFSSCDAVENAFTVQFRFKIIMAGSNGSALIPFAFTTGTEAVSNPDNQPTVQTNQDALGVMFSTPKNNNTLLQLFPYVKKGTYVQPFNAYIPLQLQKEYNVILQRCNPKTGMLSVFAGSTLVQSLVFQIEQPLSTFYFAQASNMVQAWEQRMCSAEATDYAYTLSNVMPCNEKAMPDLPHVDEEQEMKTEGNTNVPKGICKPVRLRWNTLTSTDTSEASNTWQIEYADAADNYFIQRMKSRDDRIEFRYELNNVKVATFYHREKERVRIVNSFDNTGRLVKEEIYNPGPGKFIHDGGSLSVVKYFEILHYYGNRTIDSSVMYQYMRSKESPTEELRPFQKAIYRGRTNGTIDGFTLIGLQDGYTFEFAVERSPRFSMPLTNAWYYVFNVNNIAFSEAFGPSPYGILFWLGGKTPVKFFNITMKDETPNIFSNDWELLLEKDSKQNPTEDANGFQLTRIKANRFSFYDSVQIVYDCNEKFRANANVLDSIRNSSANTFKRKPKNNAQDFVNWLNKAKEVLTPPNSPKKENVNKGDVRNNPNDSMNRKEIKRPIDLKPKMTVDTVVYKNKTNPVLPKPKMPVDSLPKKNTVLPMPPKKDNKKGR
jgi:hypothetical protein